MNAYEERAVVGAAFLDEHAPGWREAVDVNKLKLGDTCNCVLGQVYGSYSRGLRLLHLSDGGARFGFSVEATDDWKHDAQCYGWLTRAWRKVLRNGN